MHCGDTNVKLHSLNNKSLTHDAVPSPLPLLSCYQSLSLPVRRSHCRCRSMRTNDKTLVSLSACPDHSGLLYKRGEVNRSFQRRWCSLRGNFLFYFDEKRLDKEPIGCIVLEGCRIEFSDPDESGGLFAFKIAFNDPGRTYELAADTQSLMEEWVRRLSRASYDFLKFTALELDSRLQAITADSRVPVRPARSAHTNAQAHRVPFSRRPFRDVHRHYGRHWIVDEAASGSGGHSGGRDHDDE